MALPDKWIVLLVIGCGLAASGCQSRVATLRPPGTLQEQQNRASLYDPYPDNRMGHPVDELRPRDFKEPYSEPRKAQLWSELNRHLGF